MLHSAALFKNEIGIKMISMAFDPKYQWYYAGIGFDGFDHLHEEDSQHFVSTNLSGNLIGYITYRVDRSTRVAFALNIISLDMGNLEFIKDVNQVIRTIFEQNHMNRLVIFVYVDNPHFRGCRKLIKKLGGHEIKKIHETDRLIEGEFRDGIMFEIVAEDYKDMMKRKV